MAALLIQAIWLAGCLGDADGSADEAAVDPGKDLMPDWRYTTGPLLLRADLPGDGSQCSLHALARGTAATKEPVMAMAATSIDIGDGVPPGSHFLFWDNRATSQGIPMHATVAAADEVLVDEGTEPFFHPEWIVNATFWDFQTMEPGIAWVVVSNLAAHDVNPGRYEEEQEDIRRLQESLSGTTIDAALTCDDRPIALTVARNANAITFEGPPASGVAHTWVGVGDGGGRGIPIAYAGADNNIAWTAENGSWYFGMVGGDPSKTVVVTLEHPDGLTPWLALPTTYGGTGIGDVFMEHEGGPGDYRLSGTGAGTGLFSWRGLIIFE